MVDDEGVHAEGVLVAVEALLLVGELAREVRECHGVDAAADGETCGVAWGSVWELGGGAELGGGEPRRLIGSDQRRLRRPRYSGRWIGYPLGGIVIQLCGY